MASSGNLARDGVAIIFLSTEIAELLTLTDEIAVFYEGSVVATLPTQNATETEVVAAMFGADRFAEADREASEWLASIRNARSQNW